MDKKFLTILLIIFLSLAIILLVKENASRLSWNKKFKKLKISQFEISYGNEETTVLKKEKNKWFSDRWPLDEIVMEELIKSVKNIALEEIISNRRENYGIYNVTRTSGVVVNLGIQKDQRVKFYIGKRAAEWNKSYFRLEGDPAIYLIKSVNQNMFRKGKIEWLDKKVFKEEKDKINRIIINKSGQTYEVTNSTNSFHELISNLESLTASSFVDNVTGIDFNNPQMQILIHKFARKPHMYLIAKDSTGITCFRNEQNMLVYQMNEHYIDKLNKYIDENLEAE